MGALDVFPMPAESNYGYADHSTFSDTHEGLDIFAPLGTPVRAVFDGQARGVLDEGKGGNVVYLESAGPFRRRAFYAHLDSLEPPLPDKTVQASAGDVLGYVGSTGNAKGKAPHLHFGLTGPGQRSFVDPFPDIEAVDPKRSGIRPTAATARAPAFDGALFGILVLAALWLFSEKPRAHGAR